MLTQRQLQIEEQIEQLRVAWLAAPEQNLMRLVTNVASYNPENPNLRSSLPVDMVEDAEFFGRLSTYPHFARDGKIAESDPSECWKGLL